MWPFLIGRLIDSLRPGDTLPSIRDVGQQIPIEVISLNVSFAQPTLN